MKGRFVTMREKDGALVPADDEARALMAKMKKNGDVLVTTWRPRSLPQMRLYWSVLEYVAQATEWENAERLHVALKVKLGKYDLCQLANGKMVPVVHSAAFDEMPQAEFQDYFDKALKLICTDVIPGYDPERLIADASAESGVAA